MKITIDLDVTPEEMRRMLGLPDVQEFQKELLERVREQIDAGAEGYDAMSLLKPYMPGAASIEQFQRMMLQMMTSYTGKDAFAGKEKTADRSSDNN